MTTISLGEDRSTTAINVGTTNAQAVTTVVTRPQNFITTGTAFENSPDVTTSGPASIITISTTTPPAASIGSTIISVYTSNVIVYSTIGTQPTSAPNASTLSTGAKAGIGVGVSLGGLLIVAAIAGFLWRLRSPRVKPRSTEVEYPELEGISSVAVLGSKELSNSSIHEASSEEVPSEVDYSTVRAELEGDWHGHEVPSLRCDIQERDAEKFDSKE